MAPHCPWHPTVHGTSLFPTSGTELFRQYCEILDCLIKSIDTRFDQTDIGVLRKVERLILDAYNEDHASTDDIEQLRGSYGKFWFQTNLKEELPNLPFLLKMYNSDPSHPTIKRVTKIVTVCSIFNTIKSAKEMCPAIHALLRLYLTIPMSSATAERTFSVLRRLKDWTRSRSCANHLNNIMFATMHKQRLDDLDCKSIAREFVGRNDRRRVYFGPF